MHKLGVKLLCLQLLNMCKIKFIVHTVLSKDMRQEIATSWWAIRSGSRSEVPAREVAEVDEEQIEKGDAAAIAMAMVVRVLGSSPAASCWATV